MQLSCQGPGWAGVWGTLKCCLPAFLLTCTIACLSHLLPKGLYDLIMWTCLLLYYARHFGDRISLGGSRTDLPAPQGPPHPRWLLSSCPGPSRQQPASSLSLWPRWWSCEDQPGSGCGPRRVPCSSLLPLRSGTSPVLVKCAFPGHRGRVVAIFAG